MHTNTDLPVDSAGKSSLKLPASMWIGGAAVRSLFLVVLIVLTARVASPQTENIWSVFETPGDLIRVTLGFAVCAWFVVNLFILPKDADAYRTWLYLGIPILPLSLLCAVVVW
jgi:intracellular septation protein A